MKYAFFLCLIAFQVQATEILNSKIDLGNGNTASAKVNGSSHSLGNTHLWSSLSTELNMDVDHQRILHGAGSLYIRGDSYIGAKANFKIGVEGLILECKDISFNIAVTDALKVNSNVNCSLTIGNLGFNWWEYYDIALSKNELAINYKKDFGLDTNNIRFIGITIRDGCLFRAAPSHDASPIARIYGGMEVAFLGNDRDHRGWIKVLIQTKNSGWVQAYVGKCLTNIDKAVDTTIAIPPLEQLFAE